MAIIAEITIVFISILLVSLFLQFVPVALWITAQAAGVEGVTPRTLIGMRLRKIPQQRIVLPLIALVKVGVPVTLNQLETHYLAGGNVDRVVQALISAHRAQIPLNFERAAQMDLAGEDALQAVKDAC